MKKLNKIAIICLAIILISAVAMTASFSWLNRPGSASYDGGSMEATGVSAVVKSQDCTALTYSAQLSNGKYLPQSTALKNTDSFTLAAGANQYFRTVITNSGAAKNNVSLTGLKITGTTSLTINNLTPLNTTAAYSDNMTLASHVTVGANGTLNVDWYIHNTSTTDVTFTVSGLPALSYYS